MPVAFTSVLFRYPRGVALAMVVVLSACTPAPHASETTATTGTPTPAVPRSDRGKPSDAFGFRIIDIAFTIDNDARQSLTKSPGDDVPAKMTFKDASGSSQTYAVKIHIKGQLGSKRKLDGKPAFRVKLDKKDRLYGLENLTLNNMVQDATMMHEAIGYQVYEAAGAIVPATGYAQVTVNDQPYGLYLNLETPDSQFIKRQFGDASGILYEGAYGKDLRVTDVDNLQLHEGTDFLHAKVLEFVHAIEMPGDDVFYGTAPQVDTASFIAMMAAGSLLGDWDNYYSSNNYRIYWSPPQARWFFIPTGIDQTFSASMPVFGGRGVLFQKCLASERCTREYAQKVQDVSRIFEGLRLPDKIASLAAVIDAAMLADTRQGYQAAVRKKARADMLDFIVHRPVDVRTALQCMDGTPGAIVPVCAGLLLMNKDSGKCLGFVDKTGKVGTPIVFLKCNGSASQRWIMKGTDDFQLSSPAGGNCLEIRNGRMVQGQCSTSEAQRFLLRPLPHPTPSTSEKDSIQLVVKTSGQCIGGPSRLRTGSAVVQFPCTTSPTQTLQKRTSIYN